MNPANVSPNDHSFQIEAKDAGEVPGVDYAELLHLLLLPECHAALAIPVVHWPVLKKSVSVAGLMDCDVAILANNEVIVLLFIMEVV